MSQVQKKNNKIDNGVTEGLKDVEFALECYKYILGEIKWLNESNHKYLSLYQALATAIISGGIGVFVTWKNLNITVDVAKMAITGAVVLLVLTTLFVIASIIANIMSWFDYRREEVKILNRFVGSNFRDLPSLHNFWRWSETYILLFLVVSAAAIFISTEIFILPLVK
jgi:hypothetical protein